MGRHDDASDATRNQQALIEQQDALSRRQQDEQTRKTMLQKEQEPLNNTAVSMGEDEESEVGFGVSSKTRVDAGGTRSFSGDSDSSYGASQNIVTPKNTNPLAVWNDAVRKHDPLAPHNNSFIKNDPTKPWNQPTGNNDGLNAAERKAYGLPDTTNPTYPKNKDPFAVWNDPLKKQDPFAPHNTPFSKKDPFKPWNQTFGKEEDLNAQERKAYGLPDTPYPKNKDPFAAWNNPFNINSPFAPHNNPIDKTNPFKPWNQTFGKDEDLTPQQRKDYGLPPLKPQY